MKKFKKTKIYKAFTFILAILVLGNLSFCLAPFFALAQPSEKTTELIYAVNQPPNESFAQEACQDPDLTPTLKHHDHPQPQKTGSQLDKNNQKQDTGNDLPCCFDHEKTSKINNTGNYSLNNPAFYSPHGISLPGEVFIEKNLLSIRNLDLPPPEAAALASVFKKE